MARFSVDGCGGRGRLGLEVKMIEVSWLEGGVKHSRRFKSMRQVRAEFPGEWYRNPLGWSMWVAGRTYIATEVK